MGPSLGNSQSLAANALPVHVLRVLALRDFKPNRMKEVGSFAQMRCKLKLLCFGLSLKQMPNSDVRAFACEYPLRCPAAL